MCPECVLEVPNQLEFTPIALTGRSSNLLMRSWIHDLLAVARHQPKVERVDARGDLHPTTVSRRSDIVDGWRQLELISACSCALTLWILGIGAHATYAGAEAAPVARCGL